MAELSLLSIKTRKSPPDRLSDPFDARGLHMAALLSTC
jgi:hypothetical protein